jgi:hypothetical protein
MNTNRREARGGGGAAPPSTATALTAPVGGGEGIKSLADLNRRNQDFSAYQSTPLPQRRRDGSIIDPLFPKQEIKK